MLDAPRELLDRALAPLYPPDPPLNSLLPLDPPASRGMFWLPMWSAPPALLPPVPADRSLTPVPPRCPCPPEADRSLTP
ncbi:MAG: hypothetical protein ACAI18_20235, partial [Gemmatimonadales bacterium]